MNPAMAVEAEPLLMGAFWLGAIGIGTMLLLLTRTSLLRRERAALELARLSHGGAPEARPGPCDARSAASRDIQVRPASDVPLAGLAGPPPTGQTGPADPKERERLLDDARLRAEAESEAKSRVLATVSHEFRTPLNGILGMAGLLLETRLDAEQTTYVHAVRSSAEAFLRLVEDILDLSRIEAGRIDLVDEPFDLRALVQGVVELLAPRAQGKGTEIACYVAPDLPEMVRGDADRLRQVLFNLAGNAVKFTSAGGVGVSVERSGDGRVEVKVEDTGPGIPADRAAGVFDEFEQGPEGGHESGTGLGLAITRRLVDRMGGGIALASTVGVGSSFEVSLSLPAAADPAPVPSWPAGSLAVLVLSGSPFEGRYIARTLGEAGIAAEVASSLDEALARMQARRFDVVIADHALPDTDVRVVAREARRLGIGRSIVLLSPFERRDLGSPHAAGFDAFLIKPVRARSLFERLTAGEPTAIAQAQATRRALPRRPGRALRVLLAEDDEVNALIGMRTVEKLGAVVEWAKDGRQAWSLAQAALRGDGLPFDLALIDLRMPGLDGREVTRRIRKLEAELRAPARLRMLAVSASIGREGPALVGEAGFDGILAKPLRFEQLASEFARQESRHALSASA